MTTFFRKARINNYPLLSPDAADADADDVDDVAVDNDVGINPSIMGNSSFRCDNEPLKFLYASTMVLKMMYR